MRALSRHVPLASGTGGAVVAVVVLKLSFQLEQAETLPLFDTTLMTELTTLVVSCVSRGVAAAVAAAVEEEASELIGLRI